MVAVTPFDFQQTTAGVVPPEGVTPPLHALWWAAKGDWEKAHTIVMNDEGAEAAWLKASEAYETAEARAKEAVR